jgi:hypothetical protein
LMSALLPKAAVYGTVDRCLKSAMNGLMHRSNQPISFRGQNRSVRRRAAQSEGLDSLNHPIRPHQH